MTGKGRGAAARQGVALGGPAGRSLSELLGDGLRSERLAAGQTQAEFPQRLGVHQTYAGSASSSGHCTVRAA